VAEETLPDVLAVAYLELLGVDARRGEVDAPTLAAIQRALVTTIPYENVDIYRGRPPAIDPVPCVERVVAGRGGYCYHLNGGLVMLLRWLEVDVTRHVSGVESARFPGPHLNANHMGVTARTPDGAEWLVDAGLGDGPAAPLPLAFGDHEQDGFEYRLRPSTLDTGGWRFDHDPRLSFVGVDFAPAPVTTGAFRAMHTELSTDPGSPFVRQVTVQRRVEGGVEVLRGAVYSVVRPGGVESRYVASGGEWWELVIDHFGLAYGDVPSEERAEMWGRIRESHEAWVAAGRP
jgi:N-hydroxyarylamine O-acetyltransferase